MDLMECYIYYCMTTKTIQQYLFALLTGSLAIIFIYAIYLTKRIPQPNFALRLNLPYDDSHLQEKNIYRVTTSDVLKEIETKKLETIYLEEEIVVNNSINTPINLKNDKLKFISNEIQRLQFTNDSTTVLKVVLDANSSYGDFVWLCNQAVKYQYKRYAYFNDSFYFFPNNQPVLIEKNKTTFANNALSL